MEIAALGRAKRLPEAVLLFNNARARHVHTGLPIHVYTSLIDAYGRNNSLEKAFQLVEEMKHSNLSPNGVTYSALAHACGLQGRFDLLETMVDSLVKSGEPCPALCCTAIDWFGKSGRLPQAIQVFKYSQRGGAVPSEDLVLSLIKAHFNARETQLIPEMVLCVQQMQPVLSLQAFTTLILFYCRSEMLSEALAIFEEMTQHYEQPPIATYSVIINACGRARMIDEAFELIKDMVRNGHQPDAKLLGGLMYHCVRSRQPQKAFYMVGLMREYRVKPDVYIFSRLIQACGRNGRRALEIFQSMGEWGLKPDAPAYSQVLAALSQSGDVVHSMKIFHEMKGRQVQPDRRAYNAVVKVCCQSGQLALAQSLLSEMEANNIDSTTANAIINAHSHPVQ